jgi:squalene synthase HpnC
LWLSSSHYFVITFLVQHVSVGHYENFPVASKMVPARYRGAIVAIYRFARATDDIADEGDGDVSARLAALESYQKALDVIERGDTPTLLADLAFAVRAHALPLGPFRDLLSAFTQDVTVKRYATFADLLDYCRRSANPIGRLVLAVYGVPAVVQSPALFAASDAICTALQLTNFWQDVAADFQRGRIYVPQEDMARFDVAESQIADGRADEKWRALLAFETARARALLDAGRPLTRALPFRLALELKAIIAGGLRVLDRIDARNGDVFKAPLRLTTHDWIAVAFRAVVPRRASSPPASP